MSFSIGYHHTIDDCIYAELVVDPMSTYVRVRLGTDLTLFMSQEHAGQLAYALLNPVPEGVANPLAPPQCVLDLIQTPEIRPTVEQYWTDDETSAIAAHAEFERVKLSQEGQERLAELDRRNIAKQYPEIEERF